MFKKSLCTFLFFFLIFGTVSLADVSKIHMALPTYSIHVNDYEVENGHLKYPFLNYNGVTYIPLTYNLSRTLGIETTWKGKEGVTIETSGISCEYQSVVTNKTEDPKFRKYEGLIPSFKIAVNGVSYHSDLFPLNKKYLAIICDNLTYLPLTYDVSNALKIKLQFSVKTGLSIRTANVRVENIEAVSLNLPSDASNLPYDYSNSGIVVNDNQIYFLSPDHDIVMISETDGELIDIFDIPEEITVTSLKVVQDKVILTTHRGEALMGENLVYELKSDGSHRQISSGYDQVYEFDQFKIKYWAGPMPSKGNLSISWSSDSKPGNSGNPLEYKSLGSTDILYGWHWNQDKTSESGYPEGPIYAEGDSVYLLGFNKAQPDYTSLYEVNAKTNATQKLMNQEVTDIKRYEHYIYYTSKDRLGTEGIYRYDIKAHTNKCLYSSNSGILQFEVFKNQVVFTNHEGIVFKMKTDQNSDPFIVQKAYLNQVESCEVIKSVFDTKEYLIVTFGETIKTPYRILIENENGEIVFKSSDHSKIENISIDNGYLYYLNDESGHFCKVLLP